MLNKITEQNELKNEMNKYESKLKKWKIEKYDTKILEEKQKNKTLNIKIQNLKDYESKIQKLKQFEKELKQLDIKDFDYDIITIKKKFKNPYKVNEIESDIIALKRRIKLRIEKLVEKTDKEIKNAYRIATKAEDLQRLNTLNILQENFLDYSKDLGFIDYSYKDAIDKIKDLYNQTVTLNVKPKKKSTTSIKKPIQKQNYYEILNIKQNATQNQIKKMFRRLSLAYHPDKKEDTGVDGDQKFRMVVEAYEILKDPIKRKKYDEEIGIKK
jgi:DnaJ-domain-containing protein 1